MPLGLSVRATGQALAADDHEAETGDWSLHQPVLWPWAWDRRRRFLPG